MSIPLDSNFEKNVFINCPFDSEYTKLLHPLLFAIIYLGFEPRIATERADSGEQRINKICELINESKYSVHDLSRLQASQVNEYYRLNMPFELGIDYSLKYFEEAKFNQKRLLILEKERFDYQKAISDLAGVDIRSHKNESREIIGVIRNWFSQFTEEPPNAPEIIWVNYNYFIVDFEENLKTKGFSKRDIYQIPTYEFIGYIKDWLQQSNNQKSK
jgi:hypothetical protein